MSTQPILIVLVLVLIVGYISAIRYIFKIEVMSKNAKAQTRLLALLAIQMGVDKDEVKQAYDSSK